jgi:hypothetical protein
VAMVRMAGRVDLRAREREREREGQRENERMRERNSPLHEIRKIVVVDAERCHVSQIADVQPGADPPRQQLREVALAAAFKNHE